MPESTRTPCPHHKGFIEDCGCVKITHGGRTYYAPKPHSTVCVECGKPMVLDHAANYYCPDLDRRTRDGIKVVSDWAMSISGIRDACPNCGKSLPIFRETPHVCKRRPESELTPQDRLRYLERRVADLERLNPDCLRILSLAQRVSTLEDWKRKCT